MTTTNSSIPRIDGDANRSTVNHYLSVSSGDREKSELSTSNDCEISFDEFRNVLSIELLNFELPHTKYAIDQSNNTLYISEKMSETEYNFFGLKVGTSGYLVSNLAVSIELSQRCPTKYSTDAVLHNSYNVITSGPTGKVAIISSGDVAFNIHNCQETLPVVDLKKNSNTQATLKFLSPFEYIVAPGAILLLKLSSSADIEIQVIANDAPRMITVVGDFSYLDESTFDAAGATMTPVSATSCVSEVIGFGVVDFQPGTKNDSMEVLGMESPFASAIDADNGLVAPMVCVDFPAFVSANDYVQLSGTYDYLQTEPVRVSFTHDDSHFELEYNPSAAFEGSAISAVSSNGDMWLVESVVVDATGYNVASVTVTFEEPIAGLSILDKLTANDSLTILGLTGDHWISPPSMLISSITSTTVVKGTVEVPSMAAVDQEPGITRATPVSAATGYSTTYVGPHRFDLSRGRRVILCRMVVDDLDVGNISIPKSRTTFFGRIQLFSGADLVNFLATDNARGEHTFNSLVKRMRRFRLRFYNDDGTPYSFEGVDFSLLLKVVCLSSNTGL